MRDGEDGGRNGDRTTARCAVASETKKGQTISGQGFDFAIGSGGSALRLASRPVPARVRR